MAPLRFNDAALMTILLLTFILRSAFCEDAPVLSTYFVKSKHFGADDAAGTKDSQ